MDAATTKQEQAQGGVAALAGAKHVATLQRHLARLRDAYGHGNRKLFYDELVSAYLFAFFNPTLRSLRAIEDAGRLDAEGQPVHLRKLCRSTMSDARPRCSTRGRAVRRAAARAHRPPVARQGPGPAAP